jgi:hypothetical protein
MLFLAVFCGFLAENQREHMVERHREKEYIVSMIEDLKNDSTFLVLSINKLIPYHLTWLDSTVHLFQMPDLKGKDRLIYQAYFLGTAWTYSFHPTERTLSQLRSAGFHLIRNKNAADIISRLEDQYKIYSQITTFVENMQNDIDVSASSFANRAVTDKIGNITFQEFHNTFSVTLQLSDIPESATINTENKEAMKLYTDKLRKYSFYLQTAIKGEHTILLREINKTIDILNKEYHLE